MIYKLNTRLILSFVLDLEGKKCNAILEEKFEKYFFSFKFEDLQICNFHVYLIIIRFIIYKMYIIFS